MEEMSGKVEAHVSSNVLIDVATGERDSTSIDKSTTTLHTEIKESGTVLVGSSMGAMEESSGKLQRQVLTDP